jgi:uncharacterized membrane protein YgaE (UPF0421/DUF939 family)
VNPSNLDHVDVLKRTLKTAVVAFLAAWALSGNSLSQDALVTAGTAAGTAVLNYLIQGTKG